MELKPTFTLGHRDCGRESKPRWTEHRGTGLLTSMMFTKTERAPNPDPLLHAACLGNNILMRPVLHLTLNIVHLEENPEWDEKLYHDENCLSKVPSKEQEDTPEKHQPLDIFTSGTLFDSFVSLFSDHVSMLYILLRWFSESPPLHYHKKWV